mmetsp:Transcript_69024/g.173921  ORF Transcript_69024/g.173921 Transcript_69024/m.173921 type:complete len:622 (-) Transcript_69024:53-1918(-)
MPVAAQALKAGDAQPTPHGATTAGAEGHSEDHHDYHFRFNRRLSVFAHAVSSLAFSQDGLRLVSGTGSGDVKVWDTASWAEAGKLRGCRREEPRALVVSPAQRWLVAAYPLALFVFHGTSPYKLEQSLPAIVDDLSQETSEWCCIAFSPLAEADYLGGRGSTRDDQLAAASANHLLTVNYSEGWADNVAPRRARSLMQSGRPTMLVFTACGKSIVCGFTSGQLQVWNAGSLALEKTLSGHVDSVLGLAASPRSAPYDLRLVSCGADQMLRLWNCQGWILEQHVHDLRCDRSGIRGCMFSATGSWFLSVGVELCIWRLCIGRKGRLALCLHQRLSSVPGADGLRSAAFGRGDAIALGSRDGVLGVLTKHPGPPTDPAEEGSVASATGCPRASSAGALGYREPVITVRERSMARPLQRVGLVGGPSAGRPLSRSGTTHSGDWGARSSTRPATGQNHRTSMPLACGRLLCSSPTERDREGPSRLGCGSPVSPSVGSTGSGCINGGASRAAPGQSPGSPISVAPLVQRTGKRSGMHRVASMPDLPRKKAQEFGKVLSKKAPASMAEGSLSVSRRIFAADGEFVTPLGSPVRKTMQRACRSLVQRICLDPKLITDHENGQGAAQPG